MGYTIFQALRMQATQISSLSEIPPGPEREADIFAKMHGTSNQDGYRQLFRQALRTRESFGEDYDIRFTLSPRGVTKPPAVTTITLCHPDGTGKIRVSLCI